MKNLLQNRHGSVLMEFIFVTPIFLAFFAWVLVNVQYGRAAIRLEALQRVLMDSYVTRGAGDDRAQALYDFLTTGDGSGVFKR